MFSKFQTVIVIASVIVFLQTPSIPTEAATISLSSDNSSLIFLGEIKEGDYEVFIDVLDTGSFSNIVLESPGGALIDALNIGEEIAKRGINTAVSSNTVCASACAYIWLAGKRRSAGRGAMIGFHSPYNKGPEMEISSSGNALAGAYLARLGFDNMTIIYSTEAAPRDMRWLTIEDALFLGLEVSWTSPTNVGEGGLVFTRTDLEKALLTEPWGERLSVESEIFFRFLVDQMYEMQLSGEYWQSALEKQLFEFIEKHAAEIQPFIKSVWRGARKEIILGAARRSANMARHYKTKHPDACLMTFELIGIESESMWDAYKSLPKDFFNAEDADDLFKALSESAISEPPLTKKEVWRIKTKFEKLIDKVTNKFTWRENKALSVALQVPLKASQKNKQLLCEFGIQLAEELIKRPDLYIPLVRHEEQLSKVLN
jgi:hypothetical protein